VLLRERASSSFSVVRATLVLISFYQTAWAVRNAM